MNRRWSGFVVVLLLATLPHGAAAQMPTVISATHADIFNVIEQNEAAVTVVNFWATWCVPCVEEFPDFVELDRTMDAQGVEVLFVSTDFPDEKAAAQAFLAKQGVSEVSYLKEGKTTPFVNAFHEDWSGAVPATFLYDSDASLVDFWEGKADFDTLKERVTTVLNQLDG